MTWKDHGKRPGPKPKRPKGRQPCVFAGCDKPNFGHGLCHTHYMQKRRGVALREIRSPRPTPQEGFLWCGKCKQYRDEDEFGWDTTRNQPKRTCRPCHAEKMRSYNAENREQVNLSKRLAKRGITLEKYNEIFKTQLGLCAICQRKRKLNIDHCHNKGHVRGLLCTKCNAGLGSFEDSVEYMQEAITYLNKDREPLG